MKCIFIYNPNSGKGKIAKKLSYIVKKLRTKYESVDVYATKAKGDLTKKVTEVADEYDCIVFSGGDGTFNEVLRGIGEMEQLPLLGYLPGGTANDIAHSLGIPRNSVRGALKVILKGRRELLDCMRVNGSEYAIRRLSRRNALWDFWLTDWRESEKIFPSAFFPSRFPTDGLPPERNASLR